VYADKYVHDLKDIPGELHWAIVEIASVHIEGDERSRTNPGHGYPARTENYLNYEVYLTREKWVGAIQERETSKYGKRAYRALEVKPVTPTISVSVSI
jgi:hypothetical protein